MNISNFNSIIINNLNLVIYYLSFLIIFVIMFILYKKSNRDKLKELLEFLHKYYNLFFIILFIISLLLFSSVYFTHTNNVEKRFDKALQSYEQSISNIFNNLSVSTNNQTNESIVSNNGTSLSCTSTRDRISINNNNIMNVISSEGDGFDELKKSFEIGLDLLKASLSETMKNSNDVLTFWFAFLSVIMVVFSFAGYFINNNILEQSKAQLKLVEDEAKKSIKNIIKKSKIETQKIIDENNKYIQISNLFNLSEQAGNNKDYNSVIKYNLEIIKLYGDIENIKDKNHISNYAGAFYNIGTAKYELKIYDESIEYLNKAIELNPYHSGAYNNLGLVYYAIKEYDKSLNYFNYSISLNNKEPKTYNNRGICKEKLKDNEGALEDYNKAIQLNPNYSEAYNNRGNVKIYLGNMEESIKDYNKAIQLNPNYSEAYNNRGLLKRQLKDNEGALEDYNKAIELNPNLSEVYNNRGTIKEILKDNEGALEDYDKAIELNPNDSEFYYNRGTAKTNLGNIDGAVVDFDKAIELNPNYVESYFNRYISKSLLLKITDKDSENYKKSFEDAYNDLNIAYDLADEQLREIIKNKVIGMAVLVNKVAIKFCEDKGWDIK